MRERATLLFRIRRSWFGLRLRFAESRLGRRGFRAMRFMFAPPHFEMPDASIAADMAAGQIVLAGRTLLTHGRPVFTMDAPSRGFAAALAGFDWLRHFAASERDFIRAEARAFVEGFMTRRNADLRSFAENPTTIARRVISWLAHSGLLNERMDADFYRALLDHLARDAALLARHARRRDNGMARLDSAMALATYTLSTDVPMRLVLKSEKLLVRALRDCLFADGCPRDRSGATALRLAADLHALAALYRARQMPFPSALGQSMLRLLSAARLFRQPDGALANFNGSGLLGRDYIGTMLSLQKGSQPIPDSLPEAGFERVENAHLLLIADNGVASAPPFTLHAAAGALAFEFSTRMDRVIVNCGAPLAAEGTVAIAWRSGPAHSTVLIEEAGAGRFVSRPNLRGVRDDLLVRPDKPIPPVRKVEDEGEVLILSHEAFLAEHGYLVERNLTLLADGSGLLALDRFVEVETMGEGAMARLVFHLHPGVKAVKLSGAPAIVLRLPREPAGRDLWVFEAPGYQPELEESRFHEADSQPAPTEQITIAVPLKGTVDVRWRLQLYAPEFPPRAAG